MRVYRFILIWLIFGICIGVLYFSGEYFGCSGVAFCIPLQSAIAIVLAPLWLIGGLLALIQHSSIKNKVNTATKKLSNQSILFIGLFLIIAYAIFVFVKN